MTKTNLSLNRPIAFIDLETTGTSIGSDRIVEISILKLLPDGSEEVHTFRVNPTIPIPAETSAIHGIFDKDIKDSPTFKELAPKACKILNAINASIFGEIPHKIEVMI